MLEPNPHGPTPSSISQPKGKLTMADVLALPDLERQLIIWLQRQPNSTRREAIASLAQKGGIGESAISVAFDRLLEQGFICGAEDVPEAASEDPTGDAPEATSTKGTHDGIEPRYRVQLGSMRVQRPQSYWKQLPEDE